MHYSSRKRYNMAFHRARAERARAAKRSWQACVGWLRALSSWLGRRDHIAKPPSQCPDAVSRPDAMSRPDTGRRDAGRHED
ncbi:MAG: hypothetical protein CSB44_12850 [Gammaproteobacteria bacterium]|nr:MAG: hypothetical protein CSB44_12850 [Gammaproteobacteria bacterium]